MSEIIDMRVVRKKQKPKLSGSRINLNVYLDRDTFFDLRELKDNMRCKNWEEFFKKILEKKHLITSNVISF